MTAGGGASSYGQGREATRFGEPRAGEVAPSPEKRVVQVAIATFATEAQTQWGLTFAASTLATLPIIMLFVFLQRYYVQGITTTGLKG